MVMKSYWRRQCLAKNADGDLKYEAVAPEVQRAQEVFANIPDVFELRGPMRFKSGDPLIDLLQCMRQGKKLPTPLSRKFQGRFAKDAEPGVPDPRFFEDKVRYGYCVSIYWGSLARMLSHCAVLDAKELQVPLVALQAADERCDLKQDAAFRFLNMTNPNKTGHMHGVFRCHIGMDIRFLAKLDGDAGMVQDTQAKIIDFEVHSLDREAYRQTGRCHFAPKICDADVYSVFLQIRSHLESTAGQMPLRTCDADEHNIFLQIRSHLESAAGQMPLRTCDADEHSIFLQIRSRLESTAGQMKEQKGFGKFEKLKAYAEAIQEKWDLPKIKQYVLYGILLSDLAIFLLIYCLVLLIALPLHGYARAARLAWFQAVSNFTSLSIFEGLLLVGIHLLLHQVLLYSELLHSFVREILQIDLRELQIDVGRASLALSEATFYALQISGGMAVLAISMWFRAGLPGQGFGLDPALHRLETVALRMQNGLNKAFKLFVCKPLAVVRSYLERDLPNPPVDAIVGFFKKASTLCRQNVLLDGAGRVSYFSLRNLTRALRFALRLALGVSSSLQLERGTKATSSTASVKMDADQSWINVEGYWIKAGPQEIHIDAAHRDFVITDSVRRNLHNIARMLSGGRFPILLEGPTSAGKTSLVKFLAHLTGHEFVRINNHEHTDLQEYVGQYVSDPATGQLVFQEGVLVRAARAGHWVVLDELNLAPSEVLEALNRLLDDNRELYIPDTGAVVKPHEEFMVFATQNPAGANYGGRKLLSRAFRNRFTEVFVSELPMEELAVVLHKRCQVPPSYVKVMLAVYQDLQSHRNQSAVFLGKQSFMTVRDLLRWGNRKPNSYQELAVEGWALLAERLRKEEEREVIRKSLQKHCSGVKVLQVDYQKDAVVVEAKGRVKAKLEAGDQPPVGVGEVVWTPAFCRMVALIGRCVRSGEPALLVGETGGGKTMACQLISWALVEENRHERRLRTLNCHQQTETSDFIGSLRPVRGRDGIFNAICETCNKLDMELGGVENADAELAQSLKRLQREVKAFCRANAERPQSGGNLKDLNQALRSVKNVLELEAAPANKRRRLEARQGDMSDLLLPLTAQLASLCADYDRIFEWADGALVEAMRSGGGFLVDEISLAEDSVLERLNSVLEPEHSLLLAEKPLTGVDLEVVCASPSFRLFATMNPGGDFGKRELSPALRNRFTEIWVEPIDFSTKEAEELVQSQLSWPQLARPMLSCVTWFNERVLHPLSIREVLAWSAFVQSVAHSSLGFERGVEMFIHGGCMTMVDSLGLGNQLVDTECISFEKEEEKNSGGLTAAQRAILAHLVEQLDKKEGGHSMFEGLNDQSRKAIREAFGQGGFAWVKDSEDIDMVAGMRFLLAFFAWSGIAFFGRQNKAGVTDTIDTLLADLETVPQGADASLMVSAFLKGLQESKLLADSSYDSKRRVAKFKIAGGGAYGDFLPEYRIWLRLFLGPKLQISWEKIKTGVRLRFSGMHFAPLAGADELYVTAGLDSYTCLNIARPLVGDTHFGGIVRSVGEKMVPVACNFGILCSVGEPRWRAKNIRGADAKVVASMFRRHGDKGPNNEALNSTFPRSLGRLVRALQQPKAVLLEGPPGLGKTATVQALAKATGRRLLRVNLSEQTDLLDLLGSDLPTPGSEAARFRWCDGALLRAMRQGDWVLLDEINLAPQATLEGLNALLDHRREVFLPAIGQTVAAHEGFRLFAAQNPVATGGGRKGLPRSFLNRFTRVVLSQLSPADLRHICRHVHAAALGEEVVDRAAPAACLSELS
ncbi:Midasin (Dynein-related AAA-ATPase mdn1) (MIDAS-containing protein) [Durusdinium trenchii]|uniref:Midasin (Dynein-related AAA-ATPase mdn1) (MIDAS-containing protein) n=1 Tax=Durusdinium trenchii TaxID=1381693 RepID=A0ABP0HPC4_9DINO